ncbi:MAG: WYL domain-containing protein, partial [Oscillospiraceae bacterium]|nr:WYL domain-containing protein [Oscillospiraceae bacterium]
KSCENWVEVDFSQWDSGSQNWNQLKDAILCHLEVEFDYYGANGNKTHRRVQPYTLWFKEKSWYLKAYCTQKQSMRLFRLTRVKELYTTKQHFTAKHNLAQPDFSVPATSKNVTIILRLKPSQAYRVYDEFATENVMKNADESFTVQATFPEDEWVYGYILSFGSEAEVLAPLYIRQGIEKRLQNMMKNYFNMT